MGVKFSDIIGHMGILPAAQLYGNKAGGKKADESRRATIEQANLRQRMSEDQRRRRLSLGSSMMGSVPATTGDGSIRTNSGIDPAVMADLMEERTGTAPGAKEVARGTYDFGAAIPDANAGGSDAFLAGLFGTMGDIGLKALGAPGGGGGSLTGGAGGGGAANGALDIGSLLRMFGLDSADEQPAAPAESEPSPGWDDEWDF